VNKTGFRADVFGQIRQESDDVVFDFSLNFINAFDFELAVFPNRFGGTFGNNAKLRLGVTSVGFDLEPGRNGIGYEPADLSEYPDE